MNILTSGVTLTYIGFATPNPNTEITFKVQIKSIRGCRIEGMTRGIHQCASIPESHNDICLVTNFTV